MLYIYVNTSELKSDCREFPGGPVVRTCRFHFWDLGSIPGWGTKILQAVRRGQKKKNCRDHACRLERG